MAVCIQSANICSKFASSGKAVCCIQSAIICSKFASSAGKSACIHRRTSAPLRERLFEAYSYLFVFQRISTEGKYIPFHIHPKGQDEIKDQRRTCGEKGNINKPGPDTGRRNPHAFTDGRTNPEKFPFNKMPEPVHKTNLQKIPQKRPFLVRH